MLVEKMIIIFHLGLPKEQPRDKDGQCVGE